MRNSDNYNMELPEYSDYADINVLTKIFKTIDKGIVIDVGDSAGDNNDYVLDIGDITLTALNRGVGFRFWANRDSDTTNLVKIVVDTNKYNLLDMYGKNIKSIKKGTPYTVIWNGDGNFFLGSGGNTIDFSSTTVGTDGKYVLEPHTFINQNGDLDIGTMPNRGTYKQTLGLNGTIDLPYGYYDSIKITQNLATQGAYTDAVSHGVDNNYLYTRIPTGAYFTKVSTGYPEIKSKISDVANALKGLPSDKKNEVVSNLGGLKTKTYKITNTNDSHLISERAAYIYLNISDLVDMSKEFFINIYGTYNYNNKSATLPPCVGKNIVGANKIILTYRGSLYDSRGNSLTDMKASYFTDLTKVTINEQRWVGGTDYPIKSCDFTIEIISK